MFSCFWQKFEKKYNSELAKGAVSKETKFEYAWCLIRSKYSEDIKKGSVLLEGSGCTLQFVQAMSELLTSVLAFPPSEKRESY